VGLKVYIDGKLYEKEQARVSVFDHGLLYGDGVFEGIRVYGGSIFRCREHMDRLYDSARAIALKIPLTKDEMTAAMRRTLDANGLSELYETGLELVTVSTLRNHPNAVNPRIKSLNYLNNILAKIECLQAGVSEAIMLNQEGYVAECTGDNIFTVSDGVLLTPSLHCGMLDGITRGVVMELGREAGIEVREATMTRFDLYMADECFLTGTAAEIIPVVRIDSRTIGDGKPGPVTQKLLGMFRDLTKTNAG
jgi:branched-chain amino acid aminotransferase